MKIVFFLMGLMNDELQSFFIIANNLQNNGHQILIVGEESKGEIKLLFEKFKINFIGCDDCSCCSTNIQCLNQFYLSSIGYDLVITNYNCITISLCIRDKLGIPFIPVLLLPILKTSQFPHILFTDHSLLLPELNKLTYKREYIKHSNYEIQRLDKWRKEYLELDGLKKNFFERILYDQKVNIINAFDKIILPPNGSIPNDYIDNWNVVGFINNYSSEYNNLQKFNYIAEKLKKLNYANGNIIDNNSNCQDMKDLPIIFSLGNSISNHDQKLIFTMLKYTIENLDKSTKWIVINSDQDSGNILSSFDNVLQLNNIDEDSIDWLYRNYCSIVISDGKVNSISMILKNSIPSIIITSPTNTCYDNLSHFDQIVFAKRIESLNIGYDLKCYDKHKNNHHHHQNTIDSNNLVESILKIKSNYEKIKNRCIDITNQLSKDSIEIVIKIIENTN